MGDKCNEEVICSLFSVLERLDQEDMFESFTKDDYSKATDNMIGYFLRFKQNKEKYEAFNQERPFGNFINIVSKYPFSLVDFNEPKGVVDIAADNASAIKISSEFDFAFNGYTDTVEHDKTKGVQIEATLSSLQVELNYDRENKLMTLDEELRPYQIEQISQGMREDIRRKITDGSLVDTSTESIRRFLEAVMEDGFVSSVFDRRGADISWLQDTTSGITAKMIRQGISSSLNFGSKIEPSRFGSIVEAYGAPISISGDSLSGNFFEKKGIESIIAEEIGKGIEAVAKEELNIDEASESDERYKDFSEKLEAFKGEMAGLYTPSIMAGINLLQESMDNVVVKAVNKSQLGGSMFATQELISNGLSSTNMDILLKHTGKDSGGVVLGFEAKFKGRDGGKIQFLPLFDKDKIIMQTVELFVNKLKGSPTKKIRKGVTPDILRFSIDFKRKKSEVEIVSLREEFVKPSFYTNDSMKYYMIDRSYLEEGRHKLFVIDEGDSKANGKMAMVFKAVAKNSDYCILASGTAINGFPASIVPLLAYNGKMNPAAVAQNESEFTRQCGVFEINSKLLGKIIFSCNNHEFQSVFMRFFERYINEVSKKGEEKQSGSNIIDIIIDGLKREIIPSMIRLDLVEKSELEDVELGKESKKIKTLLDGMISISKRMTLGFETLLREAIASSPSLTRLRPAISSPLTYVRMIAGTAGDASITIQTREGLSGKKETMDILDMPKYFDNFGVLKNMNISTFAENNRGGVRLAQAALREYANVNFLYSTRSYLSSNFKHFASNFTDQKTKHGKALLQALTTLANGRDIFDGAELSAGQILTLMKSRTSSSRDALESLYPAYIESNGKLRSLSEFKNMNEYKYKLFCLLLEMYDSFMKEGLPKLNSIYSQNATQKSKLDKSSKYILVMETNDGRRVSFDLTMSNFEYTEQFRSLDEDYPTAKIVESLHMGYPEGIVFSVKVDMCPDDLKYLIEPKEGYHIPFNINLKRKEENQIFDAIGSLGYGKRIKKLIDDGESCIVASTRTAGTLFAFLTTLDAIIKSKNETGNKEKVVIILNEPQASDSDSFDYKEVMKRIDVEVLARNNIQLNIEPDEIKVDKVTRNLLDARVKRYRGNSNEDGNVFQTVVISNYESASRGLDLSRLNEIVVTGGMTKGSEAIQFAARLYSVKNQNAKLSLFNGGNDAGFMFPKIKNKKELIENLFGECTTGEEIGSVITELVSQNGVNSSGIKKNKETASYVAKIVQLPENSVFVPTENLSLAKLSVDKINVSNEFMSGRKTSIDSVIGTAEDRRGGSPVSFSKHYNSDMINQKLQQKLQESSGVQRTL